MSRLAEILQHHRERAAADRRSSSDLAAAARDLPPTRPFVERLTSPNLSVIAEVKRKSPSAGPLAIDLDPTKLARGYESGGATAISVLTDESFFGGSVADLSSVRSSVALPVLRKDFTVSANDVCDARLMGADAVLLIVAALSDDELVDFHQLANRLGLSALVEVHDEAELERALALQPAIIGVNQRNLHTFEVDTELAVFLRSQIPPGVVAVAESGITSVDDAQLMAKAGFDAVLVGTSLVTSDNPGELLAEMAALEVSSCS